MASTNTGTARGESPSTVSGSIYEEFSPGTGGPRYMRDIGTKKLGSHILNSHIKRPRMPIN